MLDKDADSIAVPSAEEKIFGHTDNNEMASGMITSTSGDPVSETVPLPAEVPAMLSPIPSDCSGLARRLSLRSLSNASTKLMHCLSTGVSSKSVEAPMVPHSIDNILNDKTMTKSDSMRNRADVVFDFINEEMNAPVDGSNKEHEPSNSGTDSTTKACEEEEAEEMEGVEDIPSTNDTYRPVETTSGTEARDLDLSDIPLYPSGPGPIEIIISFDTTGSMSYILDEVKNRITDIINRLFMDIPSLKIGVIAHGDYCDEKVFYLTQAIDLTNDAAALCSFVSNVEGTGGGDFAECYELILRKVRQVDWTPGSKRALIMIGDACPHTPDELMAEGKEVINWVHEATNLINDMGVKVYGVQCLDHPEAGTYWRDIAALTGGNHLKMNKMDSIVDMLMAICYREGGDHFLDAYEQEVRAREGRMMAAELDAAFGTLRKTSSIEPGTSSPTSLESRIAAMGGAGKSTKVTNATPKPSTSKNKTPKNVTNYTTAPTKKNGGIKMQPRAAIKTLTKVKKPQGAKRRPATKHQKVPVVYRQAREKVSEANFALNHLSWSKWQEVLASDISKRRRPGWQSFVEGNASHLKNIDALKQSSRRAAIYELAVQPSRCHKRYIMYSYVTSGCGQTQLKRALFGNTSGLIDAVLKQNADVRLFVRRCYIGKTIQVRGVQLKSVRAIRKSLRQMYNYLWNEHCYRGETEPSGNFKRNGIVLS